MIGERITKSCHEPLRVHQLQGAGMRKYMMNDGPTNDSIIPLYLPFCKIPKHHFEKFWNSSYPRKNTTLLGAQALNAIFFGQLLWRKDPIRDDLGWRKVGMGSSTPSTPLEKIVYEKIFRGDGYARAKCCWLLPMWAGSNTGLTNHLWEAKNHLQLGSVRDHVRTKIFWNWCEFWVGTLTTSWKHNPCIIKYTRQYWSLCSWPSWAPHII